MNWQALINVVLPHLVKIETPGGYGTGFLAFFNMDGSWCGIATAAHVVSHAEEWQQPIKILLENQVAKFLNSNERAIFLDHTNDSAIILFPKGDLKFPAVPITMAPEDQPCEIGTDIGWLGYPNIEPNTVCFFAGTVSARQADRKAYLIDGVAINGVSGGPVFRGNDSSDVQIIGAVSAYHANRATGEALPGLLRAQDVSHFRGVAADIRTLDEANASKQQFQDAQKATAETSALQPSSDAEL